MPLESAEEFGNRWRERAIEAESEIERLRTMYDAASEREHDLINERDALRNRVAELEAAAPTSAPRRNREAH